MDNFIELRQVLSAIGRRWWILLIGVLIGGALGYGFSLMQSRIYTATTAIQVGQAINSSNLQRADLQLGAELALTYADLVRRRPILQDALDTLGLSSSWQDLKERVRVSLVENTQLFEISVQASSPEEAQLTANEIARQLVLRSPTAPQALETQTDQFVSQRLQALQVKIEEGQQRLARLEAEMAAAVSGSVFQLPELQAEIRSLETLITEWDSTYVRLLTFAKTEAPVNYLKIAEPAEANPTPIRPRVRLNILLAAVLGILLATALVFVLEYLDDTIKPTAALSPILGVVTLGGISRIKGKNLSERLILRQDLYSPASEDYRLLRNRIEVMCADWPRKILMVTSPNPSDLKSITVANLGIVLAQAGYRVIIVDVNLRQPVQHTIFQIPNHHGLTGLLYTAKPEFDGQLANTDIKGLHILPVGALPPPHPAELLSSASMGELLNRLAELADIVLCDSAEAVGIADALVLSHQVDGVLLFGEVGKTRRGATEQAVYNLQQAGANLLGAILSPVPTSRAVLSKSKASLTPMVPMAPVSNGKYTNGKKQPLEPRPHAREEAH